MSTVIDFISDQSNVKYIVDGAALVFGGIAFFVVGPVLLWVMEKINA
jgi:hypothetical protein